jgi:hypothetical protein
MVDVTVESALRTLERLRVLTQVPAETLAEAIFAHVRVAQIVEMMAFLEKVARLMDKKMQWKCVECGQEMWAKIQMTKNGPTKEHRHIRRDARYCSQSCRQKAFRKRKRVTDRGSNTTAQPSRTTDNLPRASAQPSWPPDRP